MADPYVPPTRVNAPYPGRVAPSDTIYPDAKPVTPTPVRIEQNSGFGAGLIVAIVFLVVAALAYAFYNPGSGATTQGDVTIEQNAAPAPAVPDDNAGNVQPAAPVAPTADPVVPPVADPATPPTTTETTPAKPANP